MIPSRSKYLPCLALCLMLASGGQAAGQEGQPARRFDVRNASLRNIHVTVCGGPFLTQANATGPGLDKITAPEDTFTRAPGPKR